MQRNKYMWFRSFRVILKTRRSHGFTRETPRRLRPHLARLMTGSLETDRRDSLRETLLSDSFKLKEVVSSFEFINVYRYTRKYRENRKSSNFDRLTLYEGCIEDDQNYEISYDRVSFHRHVCTVFFVLHS